MQHVPLPIRLLVAVRSLMAYLGKMILPLNLVPVYPYPRSVSLFSLGSIIPIVTVIAITATCMAIARNQKMWMAVWSYYVITLMPVLGIVQAGAQSMGDRFTYLPSIGPFLIIGLTASKLYEKTTDLKKWKSIAKIAGLFMALAILVSMSYATIKQLGIWRNSIIFWNYIIAKEPVSDPFAYNNLGAAYASKGELSMAIDQYQTALRLYPVYAAAHYNLGIVYEAKGLIDLATEQYETALRLKPSLLGAHINLGNIYFSHDLFDMAIQQYQAALQLDPNYVDAYNNLGLSYASEGQLGMAIQQYQAALRLDPDYAEAHFNLGRIYLNSGIMDMARREYELGLKNKPDDYEAKQILNSLKAQ